MDSRSAGLTSSEPAKHAAPADGAVKPLADVFAAKAAFLGATAHRATDEAAAAALVRREAPAAELTRGVVERFPAFVQACGGAPPATVPPGPDVVSAGELAVAETGSVLVCEATTDRGACLLADRLWLLVRADQVVPTLDAALARMAELARTGTPYGTFMSGPSRTADIERAVTVGVHGPRALEIVLVGQAGGAGAADTSATIPSAHSEGAVA